MEDQSIFIRAEEAPSWDDPGFSSFSREDIFNFDILEFLELPAFSPQEWHPEIQEYQEPPVFAQTSPQTDTDSDFTNLSLGELINADSGLELDFQVPNLESSCSDETVIWTPSPGRSVFTQSSTESANTCISPTMLFTSPIPAEPYPSLSFVSPMPTEPYLTLLGVLPILSEPVPDSLLSENWRVSASPHANGTIGVAALPIISENLHPSPESSTTRTRRRRKKPPTIPARQLRKYLKPVECPICGHGHQYKADMKKHIASKHPERARDFQVSTNRTHCSVPGCNKTFARRDHFLRHYRNKHGWP